MASLQIRNVPEDVHRELKKRAAAMGMSLSEYALSELVRSTQQPTMEELVARIQALPPVALPDNAVVDAIRDARAGR